MSDEKCVILSGRGIGFIEIPQVEHTSKKINTSKPPDDVYNKIKEIAVKDFPYNYEVRRHTIDMEVDAYHEFVSLNFEGVAENDKLLILKSVFGNFSFYSYKKACGQKKTVRGSKNSRRLSNGTPAI